MSSETTKTGVFVVGAIALMGLAAWVEPETRRPRIFSDQGETLFPRLRDVESVKAIEVVEYDDSDASARALKAEFRKGRWILPSHYDYPAQGGDRLAKTASALLDLKKDIVVSDRVEDHAQYGVIDPLDQKVASLTGRGKRVTLRDSGGDILADVIEGGAVKERAGYRYVRLPGQKRVYSVKTESDPSARFEDWAEPSLLRLSANQIKRVAITTYLFDAETGRIANPDRRIIAESDPGFGAIAGTLARMRVMGVRPKPPALAQQLRAHAGLELTLEAMMSLRQRGFFITPMGTLLANAGEVQVDTASGVIYTARFGEVVNETTVSKKPSENRYCFITTSAKDPAMDAQARSADARFADWYYIIAGDDFKKFQRPGAPPPARAAAPEPQGLRPPPPPPN